MSDRLKSLREKRGIATTAMLAITALATKEKRDLTSDEVQKHSAFFDEQAGLQDQILAEERSVEVGRTEAQRLAAAEETRRQGNANADTPEARSMKAFRRYLLGGTPFSGEGADEFRAYQADSDTEGGYLVAPQTFVAQLITFVDDITFIRGLATKFTVDKAASMGAPTLDTDAADTDWTTELATGSEDTSMRFGKRELYPHPLAKRVKVSKKLMRVATMPAEQIVMQRIGYKVGVTQEKAFLTGTGNKQPLGLFTASADGVPTTQDVSTGNTTTSITWDGLVEAKYKLKGAYWSKAQWLFHRDALKQITKLKDGDGAPLWRPSYQAGEPDLILGAPLMMSEFVPNTFTTGLYVGMFGDFSNYWIADALDLQVQRLTELYAETNQDGFIARMETDGMPVLAEAFARIKLA
jgi:HK97 family phage major capsid protein